MVPRLRLFKFELRGKGDAISGVFPVDFRGRYRMFAPDFGDRDRSYRVIGKRRPSYLYGSAFSCGRDLDYR